MVFSMHASMMLIFFSFKNYGGPKSHPIALKDQWITEYKSQFYPLYHKI